MKNLYLRNVSTLKLKSDLCTGCGKCLEVCPHNVFLIKDRKSVIFDKDRCMECGACAKNCPFEAIEVKPGVGCAFAIINGLVDWNGTKLRLFGWQWRQLLLMRDIA